MIEKDESWQRCVDGRVVNFQEANTHLEKAYHKKPHSLK